MQVGVSDAGRLFVIDTGRLLVVFASGGQRGMVQAGSIDLQA